MNNPAISDIDHARPLFPLQDLAASFAAFQQSLEELSQSMQALLQSTQDMLQNIQTLLEASRVAVQGPPGAVTTSAVHSDSDVGIKRRRTRRRTARRLGGG